MKKVILVIFFIVSTFTSFSQDSTKIKNIKTLLELTGSAKLGIQMMNNIIESYKRTYPDLQSATTFWADFQKEMSIEDLISRMIPVYEKYYTDEDIKKLIAFYQSPVGKKVIATMPEVMQESMQIGQSWGKEISDKIANKIKEKNI